jgi:hypothetical protein
LTAKKNVKVLLVPVQQYKTALGLGLDFERRVKGQGSSARLLEV